MFTDEVLLAHSHSHLVTYSEAAFALQEHRRTVKTVSLHTAAQGTIISVTRPPPVSILSTTELIVYLCGKMFTKMKKKNTSPQISIDRYTSAIKFDDSEH